MSETLWVRSGSCTRCGACCRDPSSPVAAGWPDTIRNRELAGLQADFPFLQVAVPPTHGGPIGFAARLGNTTYRGIWVPGRGIRKDAPPWGNPSAYVDECPFLMEEAGGQRLCALVGTALEPVFQGHCAPYPPETLPGWSAQGWMADFPACGYTYTET